MKLSDVLLLFCACEARKAAREVSALKKQRWPARAVSVPFEAAVNVSIPVDDDVDAGDVLSGIGISAPPGVTISSVDIDARIMEYDGSTRPEGFGIALPPDPDGSGAFPDLSAMSRSEKRAYDQGQSPRMDRRALELVELLENHPPEEAERILWRRFSESG